MKLGIGTYTFAWSIGVSGYPPPAHPIDALWLVKWASNVGVGLIQIADNMPLHTLSDGQLDMLLSGAQQAAVDIEVGTRGIASDHLGRYIALAQRLHVVPKRLGLPSTFWRKMPHTGSRQVWTK